MKYFLTGVYIFILTAIVVFMVLLLSGRFDSPTIHKKQTFYTLELTTKDTGKTTVIEKTEITVWPNGMIEYSDNGKRCYYMGEFRAIPIDEKEAK